MNKPKIHLRILGAVIFTVGLILGLAFNLLTIWSDLEGASFWGAPEALLYDSEIETNIKLQKIQCPLLINSEESGSIKVTVYNPTDKPAAPKIQMNISQRGVYQQIVRDTKEFILEPGEKRTLTWSVASENQLFGGVILSRVYLFDPVYNPPSRTKHCGILVRDFAGLPGSLIVGLSVLSSLLLIVIGALLWRMGTPELARDRSNSAKALLLQAGFVAAGIFANLMGWWIIAIIMFILTLLLFLAMLENLLLIK